MTAIIGLVINVIVREDFLLSSSTRSTPKRLSCVVALLLLLKDLHQLAVGLVNVQLVARNLSAHVANVQLGLFQLLRRVHGFALVIFLPRSRMLQSN